jgi:hypothetical protein
MVFLSILSDRGYSIQAIFSSYSHIVTAARAYVGWMLLQRVIVLSDGSHASNLDIRHRQYRLFQDLSQLK